MDWANEPWRKLYTRSTPSWLSLPWQSRALLPLLIRSCDRAGQIGLGRFGAAGLARVVGLPDEVVQVGLEGLVLENTVTVRNAVLHIENFVEAQEAQTSGAERARRLREKRKHLKPLESGVTIRREEKRREEKEEDPSGGARQKLRKSQLVFHEAGEPPPEDPPAVAGLPPASVPPPALEPTTPPEPAVDVKAQRARVGEVYRYWEERLGKPHLEKIPPEVWSVLGKCFKSGLTVELAKEAIDGVVVDAERWPERAAQSAIAQIFGSVSRAQNFAERARKGNPKPAVDIEKIRRGNQRAEDQGWEDVEKRPVTRKAIT